MEDPRSSQESSQSVEEGEEVQSEFQEPSTKYNNLKGQVDCLIEEQKKVLEHQIEEILEKNKKAMEEKIKALIEEFLMEKEENYQWQEEKEEDGSKKLKCCFFLQRIPDLEMRWVHNVKLEECLSFQDLATVLHKDWAKEEERQPGEDTPQLKESWPGYLLMFQTFSNGIFRDIEEDQPWEVFKSKLERIVAFQYV